MPKSFDIQEIEAYLRKAMSEHARQTFEQHMSADPALREEVESYRKLLLGFDALRDEHFASQVKEWSKSKPSRISNKLFMRKTQHRLSKERQLNPVWRRIAVAASIVVIAAVAWLYFGSASQTNLQLAKKAYVAPLSSTTMGTPAQTTGQALVSEFERGHQLFQEGKYEEAANVLKGFISSVQNNKDAFDALSRQFYLESAQWTVLLCDFANGKISDDKMKKILNVIAKQPNSDYSKKAKELLVALEKRKG